MTKKIEKTTPKTSGKPVSAPVVLPEDEPITALAVALAVATLLVYWRAAGGKFVNFDDNYYIYENAMVKTGLTRESIGWAFTTFYNSNWHPLTWLSHLFDVELFGLNPTGHHVTSILIHTVNVVLLFIVVRTFTASVWRSAMVAALFALHPLHVESVAWVSERKDVLSTMFWLLGMQAYFSYVKAPSLERMGLVVGALMLGLMAKPMLVTFPFALLLLDFWPLKRIGGEATAGESLRKAVKLVGEKIPLFLLVAGASAVTFIAQKQGGAVKSLTAVALDVRIKNALTAYLDYLGKTFVPAGLAAFYPYVYSIPVWKVVLSVAVLLLVTGVVWVKRREVPYALVGWLWFLGTLVPVIGLVQVGEQAMADRYTYIPSIGLFIGLVWLLGDLAGKSGIDAPVLKAANVIILVVCAALTWVQIGYWKSSFEMFERVLAVATPGNPLLGRIHYNLGKAYDELGKLENAIGEYEKAIEIDPKFYRAHNNLGINLSKTNRIEAAEYHFRIALEDEKNSAELYNNMGMVQAKKSEFTAASASFREALRLSPDNAAVHGNLAATLARLHQFDEAFAEFKKSLDLNPNQLDVRYNYGIVLTDNGRYGEAMLQFKQVAQANPAYRDIQRRISDVERRMNAPQS